TAKGLLNHIAEKGNRSLAGPKDVVPDQQIELSTDHYRSQPNCNGVFDIEVNHDKSSASDSSTLTICRKSIWRDSVRSVQSSLLFNHGQTAAQVPVQHLALFLAGRVRLAHDPGAA